jgi:hypothetical protein
MYVPFSKRDIYIHSEDRYILQTVQKDLEVWQTLDTRMFEIGLQSLLICVRADALWCVRGRSQ